MKAHQRLLRLQRKIHGTLESEVDRLLGPLPDAIVRYEKSYREAFQKCSRRISRSSRQQLTQRMRQSDVVLVADYHTLAQAQRTALRLMQDSVREGEEWYLGLEFVPSNRQPDLDAFAAGRIDTATFLKRIRYHEEWGFPWEHYAPLIDWARSTGVRLLGINRPREMPLWKWRRRGPPQDRDLVERDRWAAGLITDLFAGAEATGGIRPKVFVLYGELHVGAPHLPESIGVISQNTLGSPLKCVCIHQNDDRLYWKLAARGPRHLNDVLELSGGHYHVISSTPWNKLQSVVSWVEGSGFEGERQSQIPGQTHARAGRLGPDLSDLSDDDELLCDLETDALSRMQGYGEAVAEFLKLPGPSMDQVSLQSVYSADFVDTLGRDDGLGRLQKRLLERLVLLNARFYLPRSGTLYLGTPSTNGSAEMASIIVSRGLSRSAPFFGDSTDTFFQAILDQAFGFFGSLLVNPRRKCDLPQDHLQEFLVLRESDPQGREAQARLLTLVALEEQARFLERLGRQHSRARRQAPVLLAMGGIAEVATEVFDSRSVDRWVSLWMSARNLGQILGKLLHQAVLEGEVSLDQVRELAWQASDRRWRPAEVRYWEWVAAIAGQRVPSSKRQMI